ncbi:MAG: phenylalanine--tRNA ligase beta subunit-related protein [Candidatus Eremiobacterota bacterium]
MTTCTTAPHARLAARVFSTVFPAPLGELATPGSILSWLSQTPCRPTDQLRAAVRALLREGGFKPSGRSKPASEYLVRAVSEGGLGSINLAVDTCNAVSLHSGLPISVVDLDLAVAPFRLAVVEGGEYVFNPSGQVLSLSGLLCLWDAQGPCGSPVKDSQRTKTHPGTRRTLSVLWGSREVEHETEQATAWYHKLLRDCGCQVEEVSLHLEENSLT